MKKLLLILSIMLIFITIFPYTIEQNWKHFTCNVKSMPDSPMKITINSDSTDVVQNIYVVFSVIEGKGKVLEDTVFPDKNGVITNNVKVSSKMGNNIILAKIYDGKHLIKVMNFSVYGLDWLKIIFGIFGGLGLFLFGMKYMSEGLQKVAGDRLKTIIATLTKNTFFSVLVGLIVTSIIQSSSATTVMVVGFVNAGLMTLAQSIGVIMGANIGTTITAQLIAFKLGDYALPAIAVGVAMILFSKKSKYRIWGETVFGFGLLFLGMTLMSATVHPLREAPQIVGFFVKFSTSPMLAMLTGIIITIVVQSSSATVGLTIVLASQGLIDVYGAVPLVFGENIGTTITAALAALSSNRNGKRAALIHALFNVIGVSYMMLAYYFIKINGVPVYLKIVDYITPGNNLQGENMARYIANSHTLFNVFNTLIFIPFAPVLKIVAEKIIPEKEEEVEKEIQPKYLDKNLLGNPVIALSSVKKEMKHMLETAKESIDLATQTIINNKEENIDRVKFLERKTDYLQNQITRYIINISQDILTDEEAMQIPVYIHSINDIERISDHAINITEYYYVKKENNLIFSKEAIDEMTRMKDVLIEMIDIIINNLEDESKDELEKVFILEEKLNEYEKVFSKNHALRLTNKKCDLNVSSVFTDTLASFEKAGDHVLNIAQAIYNKFEWSDI